MSNAVMPNLDPPMLLIRDDDPPPEPLTLGEADRIDFAGGSVTVSFPGSRMPLRLSVRNEGTGIGEIGFDGSRVSFSGEPIGVLGSAGSGPDATALRIELGGRVTTAAVETLVESLMLADASGELAVRTALVTLADGLGRTTTAPFALRPLAPLRPAPRLRPPPAPRPASSPRRGTAGEGFMLADADSDAFVFATPAGAAPRP